MACILLHRLWLKCKELNCFPREVSSRWKICAYGTTFAETFVIMKSIGVLGQWTLWYIFEHRWPVTSISLHRLWLKCRNFLSFSHMNSKCRLCDRAVLTGSGKNPLKIDSDHMLHRCVKIDSDRMLHWCVKINSDHNYVIMMCENWLIICYPDVLKFQQMNSLPAYIF